MMNLPTIRQLQYFVAVVEYKHFGKAAAQCFVTQSTLSSGIQALENLLGSTLFERNNRKVIPTPLGIELGSKAQTLLALAADWVEMARDDGEPLTGSLRLGVIPTIGPFLLPCVLPTVRRQFPKLELFLIEDQSSRLIRQLEAGQLDAAILAFPYPVTHLDHRIFWRENFYLALPKAHPLAIATTITTQQIPQDELLLLEEGHCLTDHALAACQLEGLQASATFQGTSLYTLLQMVAGGQGMTFLPELAVSADLLNNQEIGLVPLAEPGPHRQIGMVWRHTFYRQQDLHVLAELMQTVLQQQQATRR